MTGLGVTVIIPTHNRAHLVCKAVANALKQTAPTDEIIVVDDGSTDDTLSALAVYGDRVRILAGKHGGAGHARNLGIQAAGHPLIAFLDSDDEWMPDKLLLMRTFMERRRDVLFCFSDFAARNEAGIERRYLARWHQDPRDWDEILGPGVNYSAIAALPAGRADFRVHTGSLYLREMVSDYVATSTCVVRRQEAGNALHFAEDLPVSEDKECFARLAGAGTAAYFDCETSFQWEHPGPRLSADASSYHLACARLILLERIWGKDQAFLAQHGEAFTHKRTEQLLKKARWLIAHGRTREARGDLRQLERAPLSYRMLAALPGPIVRTLLGLRRLLTGRAWR
jgi:glycosyltransferase involved in cell wall biosynthesis